MFQEFEDTNFALTFSLVIRLWGSGTLRRGSLGDNGEFLLTCRCARWKVVLEELDETCGDLKLCGIPSHCSLDEVRYDEIEFLYAERGRWCVMAMFTAL